MIVNGSDGCRPRAHLPTLSRPACFEVAHTSTINGMSATRHLVLRVLNWFSGALLLATVAVAVFYAAKARFDQAAITRSIFALLTAFIPFALVIGKSVLDQLQETQDLVKKPSVTALRSPEKLYRSISNALNEASEEHGPKVLRHAILHGHVGQERKVPPKRDQFYARFDEDMERCVRASGPNSWEVRSIYLVARESRLDQILERLRKTETQAQNHSVKVFVPPVTLPYLSVMVIDDRSASLAVDDASVYRVKSSIEISGPEAIAVLIDYFDSLWLSPLPIEIRSVTQLDEAAIALVRTRLRSSSSHNQNSPSAYEQ
jgi:hypothetical protein